MKKELLPQTKIGDFLSIGVEIDQDEIGLYVASADVSASCAFKFDEWRKFVQGINKFEVLRQLWNEFLEQ